MKPSFKAALNSAARELNLETQYEKILNIKTSGRDASRSDTYRYPYEPTPYGVLERLAASGYIGKKNVLLDYGCGKGRVEFFMAYQTKCRAIGIEYDERIYRTAAENLSKAVGVGNRTGELKEDSAENHTCRAVEAGRAQFVCQDATKYEVPAEVDRIFFFNPFSVELLKTVMDRVLASFYEHAREIELFFYFPSDEYIGFLMGMDELEFLDEIECDDLFETEKQRERILIFRIL